MALTISTIVSCERILSVLILPLATSAATILAGVEGDSSDSSDDDGENDSDSSDDGDGDGCDDDGDADNDA